MQESLDQLARIQASIGSGPVGLPYEQPSDTRPITLRDGGEASRAAGDVLDPRHIVPAQIGGGAGRPPPGIGHNRPPAPKPTSEPGPSTRAPTPRGAPSVQPPPDTVGPAAAAEAAARERENTYKSHRDLLRQLDPGNPLLNVEPLPDVVPDQVTIDRFGDEVKGAVRAQVQRTIEDFSARSTYEQRSMIRTVRGDTDLRAAFERLKIGGKRIYGNSGQYAADGNGELYELPGGVRVGFRMANDTRMWEKHSVPTLELIVPGRNPVRFHYNNQR